MFAHYLVSNPDLVQRDLMREDLGYVRKPRYRTCPKNRAGSLRLSDKREVAQLLHASMVAEAMEDDFVFMKGNAITQGGGMIRAGRFNNNTKTEEHSDERAGDRRQKISLFILKIFIKIIDHHE